MIRLFRHALVVAYLGITGAALLFTLFRWQPLLRIPLLHFSYGMMAPFQGYSFDNYELSAYGQTEEGNWEEISLQPYMPFLRGERTVRGYFFSFREQSDGALSAAYQSFATQILQKNPEYSVVRLSWETWPASPGGFYFLHHDPFVQRDIVAISSK